MRTEERLVDYQPAKLVHPVAPMHDDEMVWTLHEMDMLSPDGKRYYRAQVIRIPRGSELVEFTLDLGLASNWTCGPFSIVALCENTVGQVRESALFMREENARLLDEAMEAHSEEENVYEQLLREAEQMALWQKQNQHTTRNLRQQTNKKDRSLLFPVTEATFKPYRK